MLVFRVSRLGGSGWTICDAGGDVGFCGGSLCLLVDLTTRRSVTLMGADGCCVAWELSGDKGGSLWMVIGLMCCLSLTLARGEGTRRSSDVSRLPCGLLVLIVMLELDAEECSRSGTLP